MIGLILAGLSLKQKAIVFLVLVAAVLAVFGGGYAIGHIKGRAGEQVACARQETIIEKGRADEAERQRDLANAPPASVDAMLDWLSGGYTVGGR